MTPKSQTRARKPPMKEKRAARATADDASSAPTPKDILETPPALRFPDDVLHRLVDELVVDKRKVASATNKRERREAEQRVHVLHVAVILVQQVRREGAQLKLAATAAGKALKVLGVKDLYGRLEGRYDSKGKKVLLRAMKEAVVEHTLNETERKAKGAEKTALKHAGEALRDEANKAKYEKRAPSASWLSQRLALNFYIFGLNDGAVVAMFGTVYGKVDGEVENRMAAGLRDYASELGQHRAPRIEDLCAYALWGAGLLATKKQRSEFVDRLR